MDAKGYRKSMSFGAVKDGSFILPSFTKQHKKSNSDNETAAELRALRDNVCFYFFLCYISQCNYIVFYVMYFMGCKYTFLFIYCLHVRAECIESNKKEPCLTKVKEISCTKTYTRGFVPEKYSS